MICLDSSALLKFVKPERESQGLRTWRVELDADDELVTGQLASLEISRTLLRAGVDHDRVPYVVGQALRCLWPYLVDFSRAGQAGMLGPADRCRGTG